MKTGLVLEGGGCRGIYTAGVLDVFMENGVDFDGVIGVSAGAAHGCSFVSKQKGRSIDYYMKYCNDPRFMSIRSWLKEGNVVGVEFSYHELPEKLVPYDFDAFKKSDTEFYVVVTNVETAKAEYIKMNDMLEDIDYLRASASLPYFSRIVDIKGNKYLDGGCADSVPVDEFIKMGYDKNVVILTRPETYRKKPELSFLAKAVYRKYPEFAKLLLKRHEEYNRNIEHIKELEKEGKVFVIRPKSDLNLGRIEHNAEKIKTAYDKGVDDGKEYISKLIEWLK